jgi:drug/metabolite transporter, DME family
MLGVLIALITSLSWAGSSTILKYLSSRVDAISVNTVRLWVGSASLVILMALLFLLGQNGSLLQTHLWPILIVAASGILSNALGDTVYIMSLSYLDVSRAYPISQSMFPVMTLILAVFLLGESFAWFNIVGMVLVLVGIFVIVRNNKADKTPKTTGKGVALSLLAAALWAAAAITLKTGLKEVDPYLAATVRTLTSALILSILVFSRKSPDRLKLANYSSRNLLLMACAGVLTYGIGAVGYVLAMQLIGAGKTVFLSASAPVFLLPFSVLILKERLSPLALGGVFVSIAGICLIAL